MRALIAALTLSVSSLAQAALPIGTPAPDFTTAGAIGGKQFIAITVQGRTPTDVPELVALSLH